MSTPSFIVCAGGPRNGYWYAGKFWDQAITAAQHGGETPATGRTLGYVITDDTESNPKVEGMVGHVARWTGGAE